jgi:hypothetical protein
LRLEEIKKFDRKTRKIITMHKMHHPKVYIDRLYAKRKERGRGLLQPEATYKAEAINIAEYPNTKYKEYQFVNIAESHEISQPSTNSTIKTAAEVVEELNQSDEKSDRKKEGTKIQKQDWVIS